MTKIIAVTLLVMFCGVPANSDNSDLILEGRPIGMDVSLFSISGFVHIFLLVEISNSHKFQDSIACVALSIPESKEHQWLADLHKMTRFRVERFKSEYMDIASEENMDGELARFPSFYPFGTENKGLIPYGKKVPLYQSLDWPVMPVF